MRSSTMSNFQVQVRSFRAAMPAPKPQDPSPLEGCGTFADWLRRR